MDKQLNREKYEKLFWDAEGKEFTIKTKKLIFGDRQIAKIGQPLVYDTLSFSLEGDIEEIKEKKSVEKNQQQFPDQLNNILEKENSEAEKKQGLSTNAKIWIGAGIVLIISGLITVFWLVKRRGIQ